MRFIIINVVTSQESGFDENRSRMAIIKQVQRLSIMKAGETHMAQESIHSLMGSRTNMRRGFGFSFTTLNRELCLAYVERPDQPRESHILM